MQSINCSNSEDSNGGRIDAFTKRSILPLEIWAKRQCHNFDEIASIRLRFLVTFSYEEAFLFSEHTTFTFSDNESKYNLACQKARPTHSELTCISHLPSPKWQSIESSSDHDTLIIFLLICTRWEKFLIVLIVLIFLLNMEDKLTSIDGLESILLLIAQGKQFLNIPIFLLSVLIDMKSQIVLGNRLEHQLNNKGI